MAEGGGGLALEGPRKTDFGARFFKRLLLSRVEPTVAAERPRPDAVRPAGNGWLSQETSDRLLTERDAMWRQHERAQIVFLQREHMGMLQSLHCEIEQLQNRCRELSSAVLSGEAGQKQSGSLSEDHHIAELKSELEILQRRLDKLSSQADLKEQKVATLQKEKEVLEKNLRTLAKRHSSEIQALHKELHIKTATIGQLSSELHQLRLRETVDKRRGELRTRSISASKSTSLGDSTLSGIPPSAIGTNLPSTSRRLSTPIASSYYSSLTNRKAPPQYASEAEEDNSEFVLPPIHDREFLLSGTRSAGQNVEKPRDGGGEATAAGKPLFRKTKLRQQVAKRGGSGRE